jgi:hypothetical protein
MEKITLNWLLKYAFDHGNQVSIKDIAQQTGLDRDNKIAPTFMYAKGKDYLTQIGRGLYQLTEKGQQRATTGSSDAGPTIANQVLLYLLDHKIESVKHLAKHLNLEAKVVHDSVSRLKSHYKFLEHNGYARYQLTELGREKALSLLGPGFTPPPAPLETTVPVVEEAPQRVEASFKWRGGDLLDTARAELRNEKEERSLKAIKHRLRTIELHERQIKRLQQEIDQLQRGEEVDEDY